MQTQEDEFPFTSEDPSLTPIEKTNAALNLTSQQMSDLKASLRLVVGSSPEWKGCLYPTAKTGAGCAGTRQT